MTAKSLTKETFKIFWRHLAKYPWLIFFCILFLFIAVGGELYQRYLYKAFFDLLNLNNSGQYPELIISLLNILGMGAIMWVGWRIQTLLDIWISAKVMRDLYNSCFSYLQKHSFSFFNNNFSGSLQRKVNRYPKAFENIFDLFVWQAGATGLRVTAIIAFMLWQYPPIGMALLIWAIIFVSINVVFGRYKLKFDLQRSAADTAVSGYLADSITNNSNIKLFNGFATELNMFGKVTEAWKKITQFSWTLDSIIQGVQSALILVIQFFVFYFGIKLWQQGQVTLGDFVLIQSYIFFAADNLWNTHRFLKEYFGNMADANEMTEILLTDHEVADAPGAKQLNVTQGKIEFKNAHFGYYQTQNVFESFNLLMKPGEKVALIGPSGGGKSTIVKLLFRFFDLKDGEILIDDQNISKVTQDSLRDSISLVPQDPILFHRSILDNIRYAKQDATDEEVVAVAKLAHCHEFICNFPEQYNTFVGERGVKLSGGERQRVAIARAILKNAPILVLDEATSSLDSESEMFIQDALKKLMANKTTIVIAHRLSTVMQMDRIIVLENGAIVEEGKHKELLKLKKGTYQKLWEIQAGGFAKAT